MKKKGTRVTYPKKLSGGRPGRSAGRRDQRSTPDRPVYHTYLMPGRGTFYITDVIPRSEHAPFFALFHEAWEAGSGETVIEDTPWGRLVMNVYRKSDSAYVETELQFKRMLAQLGNRNN